ncbi:ABC transporter substrate-binding protein [Acidimangrovimonas sediminis]|uniref:ABC transporter substrate-binding protein n=1 Tax=Acidimangrovimonas sediminis TaxID=2056283 RepID=UPI001E6336EE|nr:ABC transporter substrate-binding protein [Acidimangrovimonas sediminis]
MTTTKMVRMLATTAAVGLIAGLTAGAAGAAEIAVIVKTTNSNYWQNVKKGADAALKGQSKYTMSFDGPSAESQIADEVNMVENAINRGVSGILLAPSDPDSLVPAVKKAFEAGIPVVIIDSALSKSGDKYYQSFLSTDNCAAGELVAKRMIKDAGDTGKIAIMSYVPGVGSEIGRVGCFTKYVKAHSRLSIVGPYYSQSQMSTALNQTTDVLSANPDLVGIFGANEPTAVGMGRALVQSGKAGKLVALGFDGNKDEQQFIKDGVLQATAVQGSFQMGDMGVKTLIKVIEGDKVPKHVDTGVVLVDKTNIATPKAENVLY